MRSTRRIQLSTRAMPTLDSGDAHRCLGSPVTQGYLHCCFEACGCFVPAGYDKDGWRVVWADAAGGPPPARRCSRPSTANASGVQRPCVRAEAGPAGGRRTVRRRKLPRPCRPRPEASQVECTWGPRHLREASSRVCRRPHAPRGPGIGVLDSMCAARRRRPSSPSRILGAELETILALRATSSVPLGARAGDGTPSCADDDGLGGRSSTFMKGPKLAARAAAVRCAPVAIEKRGGGVRPRKHTVLSSLSGKGQTAEDLRVRRAMRRIGADEARHAQLAWKRSAMESTRSFPAAARSDIAVRARRPRFFAGLS